MNRLLDLIDDYPTASFIVFMMLWITTFLFLPMLAVAWWQS